MTLEEAFRGFERAAQHLEKQHSMLQTRVEGLERELLDSNRRLEVVLDSLDTGIAVVAGDGKLVLTNGAFDRLNLSCSEGRLNDPELSRFLEAGSDVGGTLRMHRETGEGPREFCATTVPVNDDMESRVLTLQDITQIRREEEEGGRRRRLEALGRMAAELAHEVRNPLGSIRLYACMLKEDLDDEPDQRVMAEQILAATAGLEGTLSNLLAFAAPARGARRRCDIAVIASEVCSLLSPACSVRGVLLEGPAIETDQFVEGDPEGLRQVVLNLVGNALAATESGGRIRVEIQSESGDAVLRVTDDGKGIPAEDLPRVFDPFFTRSEGGTGLGLSIVHRTVERHDGTIRLNSSPGRGTCAEVTFPRREATHA